MNYEQFVSKLDQAEIEYTLFRCETAVYVEVGRFGYRFNGRGKLSGGWLHNCGENWESDWRQWSSLLE